MSDKDYDLWRQYNPILVGSMEEICKAAFQAGRESMHREVMEEWNKPIGQTKGADGKWVHIGERLKELGND